MVMPLEIILYMRCELRTDAHLPSEPCEILTLDSLVPVACPEWWGWVASAWQLFFRGPTTTGPCEAWSSSDWNLQIRATEEPSARERSRMSVTFKLSALMPQQFVCLSPGEGHLHISPPSSAGGNNISPSSSQLLRWQCTDTWGRAEWENYNCSHCVRYRWKDARGGGGVESDYTGTLHFADSVQSHLNKFIKTSLYVCLRVFQTESSPRQDIVIRM